MEFQGFRRRSNPQDKLAIGEQYYIEKFYKDLLSFELSNYYKLEAWQKHFSNYDDSDASFDQLLSLYKMIQSNKTLKKYKVFPDPYEPGKRDPLHNITPIEHLKAYWYVIPTIIRKHIISEANVDTYADSRAYLVYDGSIHIGNYITNIIINVGTDRANIHMNKLYYLTEWYW